MSKNYNHVTTTVITRVVQLSTDYPWLIILGFLLVAIFSVDYLVHHFAISTDSSIKPSHNGSIRS